MKDWFQKIELELDGIKLVPLEKAHKNGLLKAASDGELWNLWVTSVPSETTISDYIETALSNKKRQTAIPFTVIDIKTNAIIGTTRYMNVEAENRRLEIGSTWYAKSYQRTGVNTICKFLLLQYAFETLETVAVEFRTHWFNHASRNAITRLGAKQDGVLRNHRTDLDGALRDTVVFSIINAEWPTVKKSLLYEINKYN
ncbi:GNAT family N-acetyltransferase [Croceitalea rosinachiae]|uniref:GNAT family protein n=1 Tax=Croceitalea rosinachiae TaxID=3075596 RepID=A0ABU3AE40_9FLAO|nr:GNAT family protein [Croceitalea sp. F388]MDT0608449.1 GNAT family protein [Croceitalea sp. F388]